MSGFGLESGSVLRVTIEVVGLGWRLGSRLGYVFGSGLALELMLGSTVR